MPYDLEAIDRGYGECVAEHDGQKITLRYRANLNSRAMIAMKRALHGVPILGQGPNVRMPDVEAVIEELVRVLLPSGPSVPEHERGWDVTRAGESVPVTFDEIADLAPDLPGTLLTAIIQDLQDPNRRRLSLGGSRAGAASTPTASPTTTTSSSVPNGSASTPPSSMDASTPNPMPVGAYGPA